MLSPSVGALDGLRVLDLGRILSAPFCARILGDLGAEVIKVEPPGGDDSRHFGPFVGDESTYFRLLNRNKIGVSLDLKDETDRVVLEELIRRSDVLIENFRTGVFDRLGFPYSRIQELNPRLILVSISGFGRNSPREGQPAYDLIVQALSGLMSVTGPEGGDGVRIPISIGDLIPGLYAATATLAALEDRRKTGLGQHIDISMLDGLLSVLESVGMKALYTQDELKPTGSHQVISAPYGAFDTATDPIAIAVANDALFARLATALDRADWLVDPRFASDSERGRNRIELQAEIEHRLASLSCEDAVALLESAGVPCAPVLDVRQALAQPHAVDHGILQTEPDGFTTITNGFRIRGSIGQFTPAPKLGQSNERVAEWLAEPLR